jgi:hypothetical protein
MTAVLIVLVVAFGGCVGCMGCVGKGPVNEFDSAAKTPAKNVK